MASRITLIDPDDNPVSRWYKATIDVCNSHTVIIKQNGEHITFCDRLQCFEVRPHKSVIYLEGGFYFVIIP